MRKKLAPQGWHVPSNSDWSTLFTYLGGVPYLVDRMRADRDNNSGFTAIPVGGAYNWWNSIEIDSTAAFFTSINSSNPNFNYYGNKNEALSVRCIKD